MSVHDFVVKYNGLGYVFEVFVNSNEPPEEIGRRLQKAARGQIKAACSTTCVRLPPEEVKARVEALAKLTASGAGVEVNLDKP